MKLDYHNNHRLLVGLIVFGFIALSLTIAVFPALWVQRNNRPLEGYTPLTEQETAGLHVYVAEGCMACHTQQVRPLEQDMAYGRPSAPGDWAATSQLDWLRTTPAMLGTQRTGPDLSNVGTRQPSEVWQYMHLYNPRSVVPASVMPSYPWLFEIKAEAEADDFVVPLPAEYAPAEGVVVPTKQGEALVAYMLALKQVPLDVSPSAHGGHSSSSQVAAPAEPGSPDGAQLYAANCASCHQADGRGLPGAFPPLAGNAAVTDPDPSEHLHTTIFGLSGKTIDGVDYASPMPAFGHMSDEEIAAIINHERTSWGNDAPTVTVDDVRQAREAGE